MGMFEHDLKTFAGLLSPVHSDRFSILLFNNHHPQIGREVLDAAARVIQPGVTTDEIDRVVHDATIAAGMSSFILQNMLYKLYKMFLS